MTDAWAADILGHPFERLSLDLGQDAEGPVAATLVRAVPHRLSALAAPLRDVDVLYVHGWSDYFFQTEVAAFWNRLGARFYALDLRKYGRSLRDGQTPGYVANLDDYDADIAAALAAMGTQERGRRLVLLGHSTGGLTLSLWAARHPHTASAVVLNSPWLELQTGAIGRQAMAPLIAARARWDPLGAHPVVDLGFYTRAQRELDTLPDAPERWRPERGFPTHPGWLGAIVAGHARVAAGLQIDCPVLVILSERSSTPLQWSDEMTKTDSVLVVDDIARTATKLGPNVGIRRIDGAIHDVFLSAPTPRQAAFRALEDWLLKGALRQ
ncbi:MAG: alpha/beta hydrolase [Microbacterium sp. SCN 70-200]|uniref:alpha/beta hydrolase n=1 Tax=unclassified Microbacterium TaxID=2609290 RepID=UPI0008697C3F|nr:MULTISPECIES: alpha/beta hydrolase [unclassified Microbacterium]MBN9215686.1 alpha/beta hydrolase [Microbacterium sp.]ODT41299.1 MAG: alpha/beta hydrolase [Microbacterium sp. SCN 70-200]OJV81722.1 MAG: alpha/beta hydrolase [Microbacterium sp. 70-16]